MGGRIVVKVGSQVLCDAQGTLNTVALAKLVEQLADLLTNGWQVLLVSSGAVAAGNTAAAGVQRLSDPVARKQVMAATGQVRLMETYRALFDKRGLTVAQVLATKSDFQTRRHYLNMRGCIEALLQAGIVPIINENDVVSVTELMFTDNDELAGLLAGMVDADLLCLLTTVPGVYDGDPGDPQTRCIETWDDSRYQVSDVVSQATSRLGRGGMHSKLAIARKTAKLGTEVVIADGTDEEIIGKIIAKQPVGTRFPVSGEASPAKRWLASADDHAAGSVVINQGAMDTLQDGNRLASLLPVGIVGVEGHFDRGDVIRILGPDGTVVACGRADYDDAGAKERMGQRGHKPLVHYDYLYLLE